MRFGPLLQQPTDRKNQDAHGGQAKRFLQAEPFLGHIACDGNGQKQQAQQLQHSTERVHIATTHVSPSRRLRPVGAEIPVTTGFANLSRTFGWFLIVLPVVAFLPGCGGENYAESMTYPVRTDPLITDVNDREFPEPDQPGQLPLLDLKDMQDAR